MDTTTKSKLDISTILVNLLAIGFLSYVSWMLCQIGSYLRAVAVYSLMMPKVISIWRAFRRVEKLRDMEQWVFIIITLILWILQSFINGRLHYLIK